MLLLLSGASGVGKSTARVAATKHLDHRFEAVELAHLGQVPPTPTLAWRQEQVEVAVRRAIALEEDGRHLLLAGDPVVAGEVLAAPSADEIDVAVCLLDATPQAQSARLRGRGDPEDLLPLHHGFASWLREHASDPSYVPEAIVNDDSWPPMRWERWVGRAPGPEWAMTVIDTTRTPSDDVGLLVSQWCLDAVERRVPVFERGWQVT